MNASSQLVAGAARLEITPPLGTIINGDFVTHYAQSIHDPLYAKALWLETAREVLVFVVVDICVMGQELIDEAKALIQQQLGIPPGAILVSSTHTHAAGSVEEVHLVPADRSYRRLLPSRIAGAVELASERKKAARLAFGSAHAPEHVLCRRFWMQEDYYPGNPVTGGRDAVKTNPFGAEKQVIGPVAEPDPELGFLAVQGIQGDWIGLLANYSLHYVGDWDNGTITADYFGAFSEALRQQLGADESFVGMLSNGTSGDVNIWDFRNEKQYPETHFSKSRYIGEALAAKVRAQIDTLRWESDPELSYRYEAVPVNRRLPDNAAIQQAKELVAAADFERLIPNPEGLPFLYAREQVLLAQFAKVATCPVQLFSIGSGRIGALAGEVFAETGLQIKRAKGGRPYFTIGLANGNLGYLPPARELERGGYETWRCRISNLDGEAEEVLRMKLINWISDR
ncbi:hypothetical protein SAMN05192553_11084 [Cyclobacterium xiamenense]|uniref:Neutral/alkaline non-lysosomal ceramidase, N-terminal n=1 Tax=Cyclobacterium xiamenense TaxID=1297121 RepID=A0A1H7B9K6_9BACT|nr:hypothetical protein [Cyclobacterium xiamenense]SEJ73826.1 hypothetical protein SAMN05192553_11084 [Cyclobacterium xiamenense]